MFQELKEQLRYRIDNIFSRGWLAQFALLVLLWMAVVLIGMLAVFFGLFAADNEQVAGIPRKIDEGFWDSLWWSFRHVLDPGFFDQSYGATLPIVVIALFVSIMGIVIFGLLIGFISTSMESRFASLQQGSSPVKEAGHLLILGFSNKVAAILSLLAAAGQRLTVVLLAPCDVGEMQEALRAGGIGRHRFKLILRSGSPSNLDELKRVAFDRAASIITLAPGGRDRGAGEDIEAIKTLMILSSFDGWRGDKPMRVSEITQRQNQDIAAIAGRDEISLVSSSELISKVLVQSSRQPGLSVVYPEIFSAGKNSMHVTRFPECAGLRFGDLQYRLGEALPIGVSWTEPHGGATRHAAGLNPGPDYEIEADDSLIYIARARPELRHDLPAPFAAADAPPVEASRNARRTLVLGFNDSLYDILREFDGHSGAGARVDVVAGYDEHAFAERLRRFGGSGFRHIEVGYREAATTTRESLAALGIGTYDSVIALADASYGGGDPDARTIMTLLLLGDILHSASERHRVQVVAELLDARNRELVARTVAGDIIVSSEIVSMQITQISQQPVLESIYHELLSAGGMEICLKPAARYARLGRACGFEELIAAAQRRLEIALGVRIHADRGDARRNHGVQINPPRGQRWEFTADDHVVVLAQEIYD